MFKESPPMALLPSSCVSAPALNVQQPIAQMAVLLNADLIHHIHLENSVLFAQLKVPASASGGRR